MDRERLSAVVITFNAENTLRSCLNSLIWCDEIVVVDSGSTDRTLEIAAEFTKRIYGEKWLGYSKQRNLGASLALNDWVLFVDADEVVTQELAEEIEKTLNKEDQYVAFILPFKNRMFGRWMKHAKLGKERHVRIFNRKFAEWVGEIHEKVEIRKGTIGEMHNYILHYAYENINSLVYKINLYTDGEVQQMLQSNIRFSVFRLSFETVGIFIYKYFIQCGFLDGYQGLIWAFSLAYYRFIKWMKLWELLKKGNR